MNKKKTIQNIIIRLLLTLSVVLMTAWIFSNSLKDGAASASQSQSVTQGVQDVIGAIAPSSPVANATGKDFASLHDFIRKCAHFLEFALLGFLMFLAYRSYTKHKCFCFVPVAAGYLIAAFDEYLQGFSTGRTTSVRDICIDTAGCATGCILAALFLLILFAIARAVKKKKIKRNENEVKVA